MAKIGIRQWNALEMVARSTTPLMLLHPVNHWGKEYHHRWIWTDDGGGGRELSTKTVDALVKRGLLSIEDSKPNLLHITKDGALLLAEAVSNGTLPSIMTLRSRLMDLINA